jgi:hypothetical protein
MEMNCCVTSPEVEMLEFDLEARDEKGSTALISTSVFGRAETARALLEIGADVSARDKFGRTALHWAAQAGHNDVIVVLLDFQADVTVEDKLGASPFVIAMHTGCTEGVQLMATAKGIRGPVIKNIRRESSLDKAPTERHLSLCLEILEIFRSDSYLLRDMANESMILLCLGSCYVRSGQFLEAERVHDLYVSLHPKNHGITNISQLSHSTFCDNCDQHIQGYRHRCKTCLDYDLCDNCSHRQPHPHLIHEFLTIPSPRWTPTTGS